MLGRARSQASRSSATIPHRSRCCSVAGFFELSFNSISQALVQLNAPDTIRGRVLGLYNMTSLGLRAFSGITVGLVGALITVQLSLALAADAFALTIAFAMSRIGKSDRVRSAP